MLLKKFKISFLVASLVFMSLFTTLVFVSLEKTQAAGTNNISGVVTYDEHTQGMIKIYVVDIDETMILGNTSMASPGA